jgi:hypothetical protein
MQQNTMITGGGKQQGQSIRIALDASNGAGEESRTPDLRITNALLYQLSYTGKDGRVYGKCFCLNNRMSAGGYFCGLTPSLCSERTRMITSTPAATVPSGNSGKLSRTTVSASTSVKLPVSTL